MRRTAVLFDVHGNLAALDAVLAAIDAEGLDGVVCGGDLALYGPHPAGAVDRLRERGIPCVQGNTDRYLATGPAGGHAIWSAGMPGAWTADRLGPERLAWLPPKILRTDTHTMIPPFVTADFEIIDQLLGITP